MLDATLSSSTNGKMRRAKHNSVLNFSDGSQLRRSSIDPSVKSTKTTGAILSCDSTKGTMASKANKPSFMVSKPTSKKQPLGTTIKSL